MKVRLITLALLATLLVGYLALARQAVLRTEKKEIKGKGMIITRTYRGDKCILFEADIKGRRTRSYLVSGKLIATESDEKPQGFFQTLTVFDPASGDFERFTRTTNGLVLPTASATLQALKDRKSDADRALSDALTRGAAETDVEGPVLEK